MSNYDRLQSIMDIFSLSIALCTIHAAALAKAGFEPNT